MARFNLTAQLNIAGPNNIGPIVQSINNSLRGINANVNLQFNQSQVNNATRSMNRLNSSVTECRTGMESLGRQAGVTVKRFAAMSVASGVIYGLVSAVKSGISAFIKFDSEVVKLMQVTDKTKDGIKDITNEITRLSTTLGVSSDELVNVATTLAQAGLSAKDTKIALEALAKSSLAPSFRDMNETTEGSIALMKQFGIQAKDLEAALGSVNAVSAAFAVEAEDIISAIRRTGGVFATASKGVSEGKQALNEFISVFTSVRQTTRESAETIATGLRTIFTRIQRSDTIDALKNYGVVLTDLEGKFVGPYEATKRLAQGLNSLDPRDLKFGKIMEELGGFRQIGKVIPLIQQFSVAEKAYDVAIKGSTSLDKDKETAQLSLANQLAQTREKFLALIRDVADTSSFRTLLDIVLKTANGLISLASSFKGVMPFIAAFAAFKFSQGASRFVSGFGAGIRGGTRGFANGGPVQHFARGGLVPGGPGPGPIDDVDAKLSRGEFVVRRKAVNTVGVDYLNALNNGESVPKFVEGGFPFHTVNPAWKGGKAGTFGVIKTKNKKTSSLDDPSGASMQLNAALESGKEYKFNSKKYANNPLTTSSKPISGAPWYGAAFLKPLEQEKIMSFIGGPLGDKGFNLVGESLKRDTADELNMGIRNGVRGVIESNSRMLAESLDKGAGASLSGVSDQLLKSTNFDNVLGNLFEATLTHVGGKFSDKGDANATFDFPNGLGGENSKLGRLFPNLNNSFPADAKASFNTKALISMADKVAKARGDKALSGKDKARTRAAKVKVEKALEFKDLNGSWLGFTDTELQNKASKNSRSAYKNNVAKELEKRAALRAAGIANVPGLASGGKVPGQGEGMDVIDAKVSRGEFIINAQSASKYPPSFLHKLNHADKFLADDAKKPKFAKGGFVSKFFNGGGVPSVLDNTPGVNAIRGATSSLGFELTQKMLDEFANEALQAKVSMQNLDKYLKMSGDAIAKGVPVEKAHTDAVKASLNFQRNAQSGFLGSGNKALRGTEDDAILRRGKGTGGEFAAQHKYEKELYADPGQTASLRRQQKYLATGGGGGGGMFPTLSKLGGIKGGLKSALGTRGTLNEETGMRTGGTGLRGVGDKFRNNPMMASMALSMAGQGIASMMGENSVAGGAISGASMGAGVGAMFGPWGAAIGGAIGALDGWVTALEKAKVDKALKNLEASAKMSSENLDKLNSGTITFEQFLSNISKGPSIVKDVEVIAAEAGREKSGGVMADIGYGAANFATSAFGSISTLGLGWAGNKASKYLTGYDMNDANKSREKERIGASAESFRTNIKDRTADNRAAIIQKTLDRNGASTSASDVFNTMKKNSPELLLGQLADSAGGKFAMEARTKKLESGASAEEMKAFDAQMFDQYRDAIEGSIDKTLEAGVAMKKAEERQRALNMAMAEAAMATESWTKKIETTISKLNVIEGASAGTRAKLADDFNTQDNKSLFLAGTAGKSLQNPGAFTSKELSADIDRLGAMTGVSNTANFRESKTAVMVEKSMSDILPRAIARAGAGAGVEDPNKKGTFLSDNVLTKAIADVRAANPNISAEQNAGLDKILKDITTGNRQVNEKGAQDEAEARVSSASKILDNLTKEGQLAAEALKALAASSDRIMEEFLTNVNKLVDAKVEKTSRAVEIKATDRDMGQQIKEMFGGGQMSYNDVIKEQKTRLQDRVGTGNIDQIIGNVRAGVKDQDKYKNDMQLAQAAGNQQAYNTAVASGFDAMVKLRNNTLALKEAQGQFKEKMMAAGRALEKFNQIREGGRSMLDQIGSDPQAVMKNMRALQRMNSGENLSGEDFNGAKSAMESLAGMLPEGMAKAQMKADFYRRQTENNPELKAFLDANPGSRTGQSKNDYANAIGLAGTVAGQTPPELQLKAEMEKARVDYMKMTTALEDLQPSLDALGATIAGLSAKQWEDQRKAFESFEESKRNQGDQQKSPNFGVPIAGGAGGGVPILNNGQPFQFGPVKKPKPVEQVAQSQGPRQVIQNNQAPVVIENLNNGDLKTLNNSITIFNGQAAMVAHSLNSFNASVAALERYTTKLAGINIPNKITYEGKVEHTVTINGGEAIKAVFGPGGPFETMIKTAFDLRFNPITGAPQKPGFPGAA